MFRRIFAWNNFYTQHMSPLNSANLSPSWLLTLFAVINRLNPLAAKKIVESADNDPINISYDLKM